jgi:hypothetical protein
VSTSDALAEVDALTSKLRALEREKVNADATIKELERDLRAAERKMDDIKVCVCVCMCVCEVIHVYMYPGAALAKTATLLRMNACTHEHIQTHTDTHTHKRSTCKNSDTPQDTYTHTYIHTHTHKHKFRRSTLKNSGTPLSVGTRNGQILGRYASCARQLRLCRRRTKICALS